MSRLLLLATVCLMANANALAQQPLNTVVDGDECFVSAADLAAALNMKLETFPQNKMLTFCSSGADAICIPVRLTETNSRSRNSEIFLLKSKAESTLLVSISVKGKTAFATPKDPTEPIDLTEGYNSAWPAGRGFNLGETVPDIPLVDMKGQEVRFSEFLGKRYILYCWASW